MDRLFSWSKHIGEDGEIEYRKFVLFPHAKLQCRFEYTFRIKGSVGNPKSQKTLFIQIGSPLGRVFWQKQFVWYIT